MGNDHGLARQRCSVAGRLLRVRKIYFNLDQLTRKPVSRLFAANKVGDPFHKAAPPLLGARAINFQKVYN